MNSQVPEFTELPPDVRLPQIELGEICPLLADIIDYFKIWAPESYEGYYLPSGYGLLSIISARRVEYLLGGRRTTNLYTILVDTSGMSAKTTVLNLVRDIIMKTGLEYLLLPDTITAQKLFSSLCINMPRDLEKKSIEKKNEILKESQIKQAYIGQRGWIYDEFGNLIREMMQSNHYNSCFREHLKRIYDNRPDLINSTQLRDDEKVYYPFLALLGGMTPGDLSPFAKKGASLWTDGFLSRFAFICPPNNFRKDKEFPDGEKVVPEKIISELLKWHHRLGDPQIQLVPEINFIKAPGQLVEIPRDVKSAFYSYRNKLKDISDELGEKDLKGSYLRLPEIAIRKAVLMASVNNQNQITLNDWAFAQNSTEQWRRDLHQLYYHSLPQNIWSNASPTMDPKERVHEIIKEKAPITSREIQQLTHYKVSTVEVLLDDLVLDGKIKVFKSGKTIRFDANVDNLDM